jgi:hypothetical protein
MSTDYQYEIGFSFCVEDEPLVEEINDLLSERYSTYFCPKRQNETVGKDLTDELSLKFTSEIRVVVIFYRERWDKTGYASIEASAIKSRIVNEHIFFTIWIPRDPNKIVPIWAKNYGWFDYDKLGNEVLLDVIERKIAELGGERMTYTTFDKAKQIQKKKEHQQKLRNYINIGNNFSDGKNESLILNDFIIQKFQPILDHWTAIEPYLNENPNYIAYIYQKSLLLNITWLKGTDFLTEEPIVKVSLIKIGRDGSKAIVKYYKYMFTKNMRWENVWQDKSVKYSVAYFSEALADIIINNFLDFIENPDKYDKSGIRVKMY